MLNLATVKGKKIALEALEQRRKENAKRKKIDNKDLPAGSPMYFYCLSCNGIADQLPERYFLSTPKRICDECFALKELGWLE
ncbi:MAG: hypothetical protein NTZ87_01770 [Candidatus Nomurabacteria bacterium]|nr:hypothetical protein [Candidatus Nomurabacteria bacterium]